MTGWGGHLLVPNGSRTNTEVTNTTYATGGNVRWLAPREKWVRTATTSNLRLAGWDSGVGSTSARLKPQQMKFS